LCAGDVSWQFSDVPRKELPFTAISMLSRANFLHEPLSRMVAGCNYDLQWKELPRSEKNLNHRLLAIRAKHGNVLAKPFCILIIAEVRARSIGRLNCLIDCNALKDNS